MLKQLRNKKTARKIWIGLAIIIVPAFILWGSGSMVRSKGEKNAVGKLFGKTVTAEEFKDAVEGVKNNALMQFGDAFFEMQKYLNVEGLAWERLILLQEVKNHKIKVNDKEVIDRVTSLPLFQGTNGFDKQRYYQMLRVVFRSQPRLFEEQMRQTLAVTKLFDEITKDITVSDTDINKEYAKANEEVSITYIESRFTDFTKDISPNEQETKDYFTKNSLSFRLPLSFNLEYVAIPAAEAADEEMMKAKLEGLISRFRKAKSFADSAKEQDLTVKETGLFAETDPVPGIGWSPQISILLFKAKPGEFLPPLFIDKNFYILRLKERKEPYIPDFEAIKDKVKEAIVKDRSTERAKQKLEECFKKLKDDFSLDPKSIDFEKAAKDFGLKSGTSASFKFGSYVEGIGASDSFWLAAKDLKDDEFSQIISMPNAFYVIKVKARVPVDEKKFAEEKAEFSKKFLLQKKEGYFNKFVEDLKERAKRF